MPSMLLPRFPKWTSSAKANTFYINPMHTQVVYLTVPYNMGRILDTSTNVRIDSTGPESLTLIINVDKDFYAMAS